MGRHLSLLWLRGESLHLEAEPHDGAAGVMDQFHQAQVLEPLEMTLDCSAVLDRITLLDSSPVIDRWQAGDVVATGQGALQQAPERVGQVVVQVCSAADVCSGAGLGDEAEQFVFELVLWQQSPVTGQRSDDCYRAAVQG